MAVKHHVVPGAAGQPVPAKLKKAILIGALVTIVVLAATKVMAGQPPTRPHDKMSRAHSLSLRRAWGASWCGLSARTTGSAGLSSWVRFVSLQARLRCCRGRP